MHDLVNGLTFQIPLIPAHNAIDDGYWSIGFGVVLIYGVGDELDKAGSAAGLAEGAAVRREAAEFVGWVGGLVGFGGVAEVPEADRNGVTVRTHTRFGEVS